MSVRKASANDVLTILELLKAKAEFDRTMRGFNGTISASESKLKTTLFSDTPFAHVLLIDSSTNTVGMAFYHYRFSSFCAQPSIWLDDLFVLSDFRSNGFGEKLMDRLHEEGKQIGASHISWTASPDNKKVLQFYERIGAQIEKVIDNRPFYHWKVSS